MLYYSPFYRFNRRRQCVSTSLWFCSGSDALRYNAPHMMPIYDLRVEPFEQVRVRLRQAVLFPSEAMEQEVRALCERVRQEGDRALLELSRRWDCPHLERIEVTAEEWEQAYRAVSSEVLKAIREAIARVRRYHEAMRPTSWWLPEPKGGLLGQQILPLRRVGLYVPGGRARYPSTVIMNGVPARVAGVEEVILCSPAQPDGTLPASVLVAAQEVGIRRVFKVGGAQAIAAMAFGTESIPQVEKIVGPGNLYVNLAKRMLWGQVGVDLWAGPSEAAIVADEHAPPGWVASDLLTQLEHGAESRGYLFSPSEATIQRTLEAVENQLAQRARRPILEQSLAQSVAVITRTIEEALELVNEVAPEHLSLMVQEPLRYLPQVRNAGCILLGMHAPQSAGDYLAGPSHTLPTGRAARFESPVSVETFLKRSSVLALTPESLAEIAPSLKVLAEEEGFDGHAYAVQVRQPSISDGENR